MFSLIKKTEKNELSSWVKKVNFLDLKLMKCLIAQHHDIHEINELELFTEFCDRSTSYQEDN